MPLSDDELDEIEAQYKSVKHNAAWRLNGESAGLPEDQIRLLGLIERAFMQDIPTLIAEVRALRSVKEAGDNLVNAIHAQPDYTDWIPTMEFLRYLAAQGDYDRATKVLTHTP